MAKIPCTYFQQGKCRRGDKCFYKHENAAAPAKDPKRTNSPAPKKKASAKAAPCIAQRYACIAKGKGLPKATKTPPKEGASAPSAPEVPKAVTAAVEPAKEEEPAKNEAALSSVPAAVPVASSAAAFLEPVPKIAPPKAHPKGQEVSTAVPPSPKLASGSKSLVQWSLALKAMTNHQRRRSRCRSRLRPNNVSNVSQKPSKDSLSATSVDWCLKELARPTEPRSPSGAKLRSTS